MYVDAFFRLYNKVQSLSMLQPSMAQGVERFFKAAIVDRNPSISSAALVSSYHLFPLAKDVVKRWVNEAQEAVNAKSSSSFFGASTGGSYLGFATSAPANSGQQTIPSTSYITQYHALGLLYFIRQQDRMAVTKMIQQLGGGKSGAGTTLKNPMALCMLIRYAAKVMEEDPKSVFLYEKYFWDETHFVQTVLVSKNRCLNYWRAG
jgi:coatomer protein complex subunit gamma